MYLKFVKCVLVRTSWLWVDIQKSRRDQHICRQRAKRVAAAVVHFTCVERSGIHVSLSESFRLLRLFLWHRNISMENSIQNDTSNRSFLCYWCEHSLLKFYYAMNTALLTHLRTGKSKKNSKTLKMLIKIFL